jgi:hypothetical protein
MLTDANGNAGESSFGSLPKARAKAIQLIELDFHQ